MPLFSNSKLLSAWSTRTWEINAQRLQDNSDILYDCLRSEFLARRQDLQASLLEVIQTSTTKQDLEIPLWTYHYSSFVKPFSEIPPAVLSETKELLRKKGYNWIVGLVRPWLNSEDLDRYWTLEYLWEMPPTSVHTLLRKTDILERLALLFGDNFRIVSVPMSTRTLSEPTEVRIIKAELRLQYFPKGLPSYLQEKHNRARERYADYACPEWYGRPYVWSGCREEKRPQTPPPPPVPAEPPALPRRSNGGGIQLPEQDDVYRRLDFSVDTYDGPDALEHAARDMLASCYCGHHHEED